MFSGCFQWSKWRPCLTTDEQSSVVRFLWTKRVKAKDIHKEMLPVCCGKCMSRKAVHNWVEKFHQGRSKIADDA
jgi:hypothetical protein